MGSLLVPGLPSDFAAAALTGLKADADNVVLPAGVVRVDRAGYDVMGSSDAAFELAGRLLRQALATSVAGGDVNAALRTALESLA